MITSIGVVGAGQMGSGIAQVSACAGYQCIVSDLNDQALDLGQKNVLASLKKLEAKGLLKEDADKIASRISWCGNISRLNACDLVIEAVVENEQVKNGVLKALDETLKKDAIIASNTSSISITRLALATNRPEQVIGMHFMNPVPLMSLVEIIRGAKTSEKTVESIQTVVQRMGKIAATANDFPGFIANRILMPMINEAFFALFEGVASAKDIDLTMKHGCNMPMGPLALADLIGLDTCLAILEVMKEGLGDKYSPCPLLKEYVLAKRLGRKTKLGVYEY